MLGERKAPPAALLGFYIVVLVAALAGAGAYTAGASVEGALIRAGVILLLCTIIGYAANVALGLAAGQQQAAATAPSADAPVAAPPGQRLNVMAGDDD